MPECLICNTATTGCSDYIATHRQELLLRSAHTRTRTLTVPNHITSIGGTSETLAAVGASGSKRCCQTQAPHAKGYDAKLISCTHTDKSYQQISVTVCNVDFVILVLCLFLLRGSEGGRGLWHFVRQQYAGPSLHKSSRKVRVTVWPHIFVTCSKVITLHTSILGATMLGNHPAEAWPRQHNRLNTCTWTM